MTDSKTQSIRELIEILFRSLLLGQFEMMFAHTLVWKMDKKSYDILPTRGKIIRDRNVASERLGVYLHPDFHNFSFSTIKNEIREKIEDLDQEREKQNYVDDKISFLNGLIGIMDAYCRAENPYENAKKDFEQLLKSQSPRVFQNFIGKLAVMALDSASFNTQCWLKYEVQSKCFSQKMTNEDLIKFYSDDNCFNEQFVQSIGAQMCLVVRMVICRFLGKDQMS